MRELKQRERLVITHNFFCFGLGVILLSPNHFKPVPTVLF